MLSPLTLGTKTIGLVRFRCSGQLPLLGLATHREKEERMEYGFWASSMLLSFGLLSFAACKDKPPEASVPPRAAEATTEAVSDEPAPSNTKPESITLNVRRAFDQSPVAVQLLLPASWMEGSHDEVARLLPKSQPDEFHQTVLEIAEGNTSCEGTCDTEEVMANINAAHESFQKRLTTPNRNTGDATKDAYRAKVEVLEDAEEEGETYKRVFAAKVTCPDKGTIPCMPQLAARCYQYQEGQEYYLVATGKGPLAAEVSAWPEVMALCKGITLAGPK